MCQLARPGSELPLRNSLLSARTLLGSSTTGGLNDLRPEAKPSGPSAGHNEIGPVDGGSGHPR